MLDPKYYYALEKFTQAIWTLATAPGDVRERLLSVFQGPLLMTTHEHLPEDLREDYRWIEQQIARYDEKYKGQREWLQKWEKRNPNFRENHADLYLTQSNPL